MNDVDRASTSAADTTPGRPVIGMPLADEHQTDALDAGWDAPGDQGCARIPEDPGEQRPPGIGLGDEKQVLDRHTSVSDPVGNAPTGLLLQASASLVGPAVAVGVGRRVRKNHDDGGGVDNSGVTGRPPFEGPESVECLGHVGANEEMNSL